MQRAGNYWTLFDGDESGEFKLSGSRLPGEGVGGGGLYIWKGWGCSSKCAYSLFLEMFVGVGGGEGKKNYTKLPLGDPR